MRVLVTRPQESTGRFARDLEAAGHQALISPVIRIEGTGFVIPDERFDGIIATSAHAFEILQAEDTALSHLRALPLYAVGERTAAAARSKNFSNIACVRENSTSLASFILDQLPASSNLLYLAGENRKPALESELNGAGHQVIAVAVYRAAAMAELSSEAITSIRTGEIGAIVHFSQRSAQIFTRLVIQAGITGESRDILHICLSADVQAGLADLAPVKSAVAAIPGSSALIQCLGGGD